MRKQGARVLAGNVLFRRYAGRVVLSVAQAIVDKSPQMLLGMWEA